MSVSYTTRKDSNKSIIEVELPTLIKVSDYHEIPYVQDHLKALNPQLKCKEYGGGDLAVGYYVGIIYMGRPPKKAEIQALLERHGIV